MITAADLAADARRLVKLAERVRGLMGQTSKRQFMAALDDVAAQVQTLRHRVIVHSRSINQGVRRDGKPDMRFAANRGQTGTDLRRSRG